MMLRSDSAHFLTLQWRRCVYKKFVALHEALQTVVSWLVIFKFTSSIFLFSLQMHFWCHTSSFVPATSHCALVLRITTCSVLASQKVFAVLAMHLSSAAKTLNVLVADLIEEPLLTNSIANRTFSVFGVSLECFLLCTIPKRYCY